MDNNANYTQCVCVCVLFKEFAHIFISESLKSYTHKSNRLSVCFSTGVF